MRYNKEKVGGLSGDCYKCGKRIYAHGRKYHGQIYCCGCHRERIRGMLTGMRQTDWIFSSPQLISINLCITLTVEQREFLTNECSLHGLTHAKYLQCLLESYRLNKKDKETKDMPNIVEEFI